MVSLTTIDEFCAARGVVSIDYLKIDTEGNDLNVLIGAAAMLDRNAIKIIAAEVSTNHDNMRHVPFDDIYRFMCPKGYRVFGLYEQTPEFFEGRPNLRRANVVYISREVIARNEVRN